MGVLKAIDAQGLMVVLNTCNSGRVGTHLVQVGQGCVAGRGV